MKRITGMKTPMQAYKNKKGKKIALRRAKKIPIQKKKMMTKKKTIGKLKGRNSKCKKLRKRKIVGTNKNHKNKTKEVGLMKLKKTK